MVEKQRQLEAEIQDLTDLIGIAHTVVSTLELDKVLKTILDNTLTFMGMSAGMLAVYHENSGEMVLHVHTGLSGSFVGIDRWPLDGRGDGLTREAMAELAIRHSTLTHPGEGSDELCGEGIRSAICVPLTAHNKPVGVLHLFDRTEYTPAVQQLNHLAVIASFAAMAINNASLHKRTKLMALTDALTGLYNNRYFMQVFPHELVRSRRYMKPLSLIMIDVDNFKKLNDTFGHPKGDQVLAGLGNILSGSLRAADFSFRYGGEEFALILPETRLEGAFLVAESLREKISQTLTPLLGRGTQHQVTVSLGVAGYPSDGTSTDQLLAHADACLYLAKRQGRDRVHWEITPSSMPAIPNQS